MSGFTSRLETALVHYVGVGFLILAALFIYLVVYPGQINQQAGRVLEGLTLGYLIFAPFYYFWLARRGKISSSQPSRTFVAAIFFWQLPPRLTRIAVGRNKDEIRFFPDAQTQQAVLGVIVKFFFAPLMISFFFANIDSFVSNASVLTRWMWGETFPSPRAIWRNIYGGSFHLLLIIDTIIFAFAYLVESDRLGNKIRSVDPTFTGWLSAMVCYPPFSFFTRQTFSAIGIFSIPDRSPAMDFQFIILFQSLALVLFAIYVWATVALGTRAGNLVNRGIVAFGPYRYIRHPAYAAKNLAWFFEILPFFHSPLQLVSWGLWAGIYVARAVTEERHLAKDPSYLVYCQRVNYRFIPGLV